PGMDLSDRAYFRRAMERKDFAVGDFQIGRITNRPSINIACPILHPVTGAPRRVVYAAIDLTWLEKLASRAALPEGGTLAVVDAKGIVLAAWPQQRLQPGESIRNAKALEMIAKG